MGFLGKSKYFEIKSEWMNSAKKRLKGCKMSNASRRQGAKDLLARQKF